MNANGRVFGVLLMTGMGGLHAGMPSITTLSDLGAFRLQSLSFFLVGFFLLSVVVWRLWNHLRRDFPRLPALRYRGAVALLGLWGLLVLVVLTMISGARELLSPKAWVKDGLTYRLSDEVANESGQRRAALEDLRSALWQWADTHDGQLPPHEFGAQLPERRWQIPGTAFRYQYAPEADRSTQRLLAWEPEGMPEPRLVLRANGEIAALSTAEIRASLGAP